MLESLSALFHTEESNPHLDQGMQQLVEQVNPLLLQCPTYPSRYRKVLHPVLDYVEQLVEQVPGPVCLTAETFRDNPLVRALFVSPRDLEEKLRLSIAMREYHPALPGKQTLFAVMGVRWSRLQRFGVEVVNGVTQREVPQQSIDFHDHTFTLPSASEQEVRDLLRDHFIQRLASQVRSQMNTLQQQRDSLYNEAKQKERALRKRDNNISTAGLSEEIEQSWEQWRNLNVALDTRHAIDQFEVTLRDPQQALRLAPFELSMDRMGIERPPEQGGTPLQLVELHGADRRIWTIMLVQFQWQRPSSISTQLEAAHRWLSIS